MIETRRLKNVVTFVQTIVSFVLSRKIIYIYVYIYYIYSERERERVLSKLF